MKLINQILEYGKISILTSSRGSGTTGEAHLAQLKSKKYVLRICPDKKTAEWYIFLYRRLGKYEFLPKIIESQGKYLLLEYITGRDLKEKENKKIIYKVGKICARVNKTKYAGKYKNKFLDKLTEITDKKIVSEEKSKQIEDMYKKLKRKVKPHLSLDIGDTTNDNFRFSKEGKVYFVDIEAIKYHIKGMSIAKAFYQWFKRPAERKSFIEGYKSEHPISYLTEDYLKLCSLIFLIQRIRFKHNKGEKAVLKKALLRLDELLEEKDIA
jgi:Ser/Thr protein kinase RdoA (MazF antagonist)